MKITKILDVHQSKKWRAWLKMNHKKAKEIWLVYYKKQSGKPSVSYNDAVDEALCFGWIDSTVKTLDNDRYCQRFSPRRPGSSCSELNKHRAVRLIKERRMTPAGLAALEGTLGGGAVIHKGRIRHEKGWSPPMDILAELKKSPLTWNRYRKFPLAYRRIRIGWIDAVRYRPVVFKQRLRYFLKMTSKNKKFGMVQK